MKDTSAGSVMPGEGLDMATMPVYWMLARIGKRVLRPGGRRLIRSLLGALHITPADVVVELAPGLGMTTQLIPGEKPRAYTGFERDQHAAEIVKTLLSQDTHTDQVGSTPSGSRRPRTRVVPGSRLAMATVRPGRIARAGWLECCMKVEVWSDVACPWCYVGTARFERAVDASGIDADVVYRSFQLDPAIPMGGDGPNAVQYLAKKLGGPEQVAAIHARLEAAAGDLDIEFCWSQMRRANTFDAHRLLGWALHSAGAPIQRTLKKALLRAYFTESLDITDHDVLAGLAANAGLDRGAAAALLDSDAEADHVRAEREEAYRNGITAVPTFVVESRWLLRGAIETDEWVAALRQMSAELDAS